jgi:hypothetical protein
MAEARGGPRKKAATREEFARLMEISHQDVTKLVLKGILTRGAPIGQWLVEYGRHMRKVAAGWQSEEGYDLIAERGAPRFERSVVQFNPSVCVVNSPGYSASL